MPSATMKHRFDDHRRRTYGPRGEVGQSAKFFADYEASEIHIKLICKEADAAEAYATKMLREYAKKRHAEYHADYSGYTRASKAYSHAKCEAEDLALLYQMELSRSHLLKVEAQRLENEEALVAPKGGPGVAHAVAQEIMALPDDAPAVGVLVCVEDATKPIEYTVFSAKECFDLDLLNGIAHRIAPTGRNFAGRVLQTLLSFAHHAGDSQWEGKNWGMMTSLGIKGGSVARVMAHFASDTMGRSRWKGYGKYKLDMRQLGSLRDLLRTGPPLWNNRTNNVSNDPWYHCDEGEFYGALEAARPKEDGPFGMVRLTRYLCEEVEWEDGLKQALLGYAQEHVEELREPAPLLKEKSKTEPLVVVTRRLNKLQASIYPTLLRSPPPTPRPMSPFDGSGNVSDPDQ